MQCPVTLVSSLATGTSQLGAWLCHHRRASRIRTGVRATGSKSVGGGRRQVGSAWSIAHGLPRSHSTVELPGQIRSNQRDFSVYWMRPRINATPKSGSCNDQNCNVNGDKDIKLSSFLAFGTRAPLPAMRRGPSLASMKRELLALSATCCRKRETVEAGNRPASLRFGAGKLPEAAQCVMSAPRKQLPY